MGNTEVTGTVDEKDSNIIIIKGGDGTGIRYAKESDLLAVKGSRDELQIKLTAAEADKGKATSEADTKAAEARQQVIKAEADVERLSDDIKKHTGTTEELTKLKGELETAQTAGKSTATALLEMRRTHIVSTYKVPQATVAEKDLAQLGIFEEALKAVTSGNGGNYAFGGGSGGPGSLEGKSLQELGQLAYADKK